MGSDAKSRSQRSMVLTHFKYPNEHMGLKKPVNVKLTMFRCLDLILTSLRFSGNWWIWRGCFEVYIGIPKLKNNSLRRCLSSHICGQSQTYLVIQMAVCLRKTFKTWQSILKSSPASSNWASCFPLLAIIHVVKYCTLRYSNITMEAPLFDYHW